MSTDPLKILVVESEPKHTQLIKKTLSEIDDLRYLIASVNSLKDARDIYTSESVDFILLDPDLPDGKGVDTFRQVRDETQEAILIGVTRQDDLPYMTTVLESGAQDILPIRELNARTLGRSLRFTRTRAGAPAIVIDPNKKPATPVKPVQRPAEKTGRPPIDLALHAEGIAQEIESLFTAILGNTSLLQSDTFHPRESTDILSVTDKACIHGKLLAQQLEAMTRHQSLARQHVSVEELVRQCAETILSRPDIALEIEVPDTLPEPHVEDGQLAVVFDNLFSNAQDAMPDGGTIRVTAQVTNAEENLVTHAPFLKPGPYLKIIFEDRGYGIPQDEVGKIFDPFFTTKSEGSGIGLATVYSIMIQQHGHITVQSEPGKGTLFTLYLPLPNEVGAEPEETAPGAAGEEIMQRILVLDDEEAMCTLMKKIFTRFGYEVAVTKKGEETIEVYRQSVEEGKPFDLVILDLTIPHGMGGEKAIEKLLEINPEVKALATSGYSEGVGDKCVSIGFTAFIGKPFKVPELTAVAEKLMS